MSTIIMNKCWPLEMTPSQKSVLISLADNASDEGVCWPSIKTICKRTCLSERAVQRAINWLEEQGLLVRDPRYKRSTMYQFNLIELDNFLPVTVTPVNLSGDTVTPSAPSPCRFSPVTVTPRTIKEPSIEPSLKNNKRAKRLPDNFVMPDEWIVIGKELRPELTEQDIKLSADKFIDHWHAKSGKDASKVSWIATWRNWIRNDWIKPSNVHQFPDKKPSMQANTSNINYREGLRVGPDGEYIF